MSDDITTPFCCVVWQLGLNEPLSGPEAPASQGFLSGCANVSVSAGAAALPPLHSAFHPKVFKVHILTEF